MRPTPKSRPDLERNRVPLAQLGAPTACPLCRSATARPFLSTTEPTWRLRHYFQCDRCRLVYLAPAQRLSAAAEKARYDLHRNHPQDEGYVRFLRRLADPLVARLRPGSKGLDFGCGPGPALAELLERHGHTVRNYDPFYFPDAELLERRYDFLTCTEVVEHLFSPEMVFLRLRRLLAGEGSILGIMTAVLEEEGDFEHWWYRRDPTHVAFYTGRTLEWIAAWMGWKMEIPSPGVILYTA